MHECKKSSTFARIFEKNMQIRKYIVLLALVFVPMVGQAATEGLKFFYRLGERVDRFLLSCTDTNYITLPEHSWSMALTGTGDGINTYYSTTDFNTGERIILHTHATPSANLGFYGGYRTLCFGYSWDLIHSYDNNLQLSLGSKFIGIEFQRQVSSNIKGSVYEPGRPSSETINFPNGLLRIKNINLTAWYALNSRHYSHNSAIKQAYIQKRTAGSLLLSISYLSTNMSLLDELAYIDTHKQFLVDSVKRIVSHQIAVGIGYGINYTPNKGKVLLHVSGNAQLVCYSINQLSFALTDAQTRLLRAEPLFNIKPKWPVHVTGNFRAAVSWEINKWVHLSVWAKASNIRFRSHQGELADIRLRHWNWQVHLNIGVRFGAGKKRVRDALIDDPLPPVYPEKPSKLPKWVTDFFFSPRI